MSRPIPAPSRPIPECHLCRALEVAGAVYDTRCTGSLCSAFVRVPSPVDPKLRQGVCGLVGGKCEPWPDTAPVVGEVGGE